MCHGGSLEGPGEDLRVVLRLGEVVSFGSGGDSLEDGTVRIWVKTGVELAAGTLAFRLA